MKAIMGPGPVIRVRIRHSKGQWTIDKQVRVGAMTLPPPQELPRVAGRAPEGFWFELTDHKGRVLWRRGMADPACCSVELQGGSGDNEHAVPDREDSVFEVLVPELPDAAFVLLFANTPKPGLVDATSVRATTPIAKIDLRPAPRKKKG